MGGYPLKNNMESLLFNCQSRSIAITTINNAFTFVRTSYFTCAHVAALRIIPNKRVRMNSVIQNDINT